MPKILFQLDFMSKANRAGLPVPKVIWTAKNKKLFGYQKKYGALFGYIPARHLYDIKFTPSILYRVGKLLGGMHKFTMGMEFDGKPWKKYAWDLAQFSIVAKDFEKVKKFFSKKVEILITQTINDWENNWPKLKKLKTAVIHGDFHGANLLIDKNNKIWITDFGDANQSYLLADIAVALAHLCMPLVNYQNLARAFVKGYTSIFSLNNKEKRFLPLLVRMRACTEIVESTLDKKNDALDKKLFSHALKVLNRPLLSI